MNHTRACWELSNAIIGACIDVHRQVGPGLLEHAYEECLVRELTLRGIRIERQKAIPLSYKGIEIPNAYRIDLIVGDLIVVEVKAVGELLAVHEAQVLTYLQMLNLDVGLLINFSAPTIRAGLRRLIRKGADIGHWSRD
jgi:GxxExxY protein